MKALLDAKKYGLNSRTKLVQISETEIAVYVDRKSRFIMNDGNGFMKKVATIQKQFPDLIISLKIDSPICSKTLNFLEKQKIRIYQK